MCWTGDTDSVFFTWGPDVSRELAASRGEEYAKIVSSHFRAPIKIEYEKTIDPFLLFKKKRYGPVYHLYIRRNMDILNRILNPKPASVRRYCGRQYDAGQTQGKFAAKVRSFLVISAST